MICLMAEPSPAQPLSWQLVRKHHVTTYLLSLFTKENLIHAEGLRVEAASESRMFLRPAARICKIKYSVLHFVCLAQHVNTVRYDRVKPPHA